MLPAIKSIPDNQTNEYTNTYTQDIHYYRCEHAQSIIKPLKRSVYNDVNEPGG